MPKELICRRNVIASFIAENIANSRIRFCYHHEQNYSTSPFVIMPLVRPKVEASEEVQAECCLGSGSWRISLYVQLIALSIVL